MQHDIVVFFQKVWSHNQHKEPSFSQRSLNRVIKALSRYEVFVIPYCDVPIPVAFVDHPHQFLGVGPVFLAVGKEDIRIKSIADTLRHLRPDQHTLQVFLQLLLKGDGCDIDVPRHKVLEITEYFPVFVIQARLEQDGQNRDMFLIGKWQDLPDSAVFCKKKPGAHRHDD